MSVLVLDNKRIILKGIKGYELGSDKLYHRNDKEEDRFLFIFLINKDELWCEYSFKYLMIQMVDGKSYYYYSDKILYALIEKMANYFEEMEMDLDGENGDNGEYLEEVFEEDEHLGLAVESYLEIKDKFTFIHEDISNIARKMDYAFGTI